MPRAFNSATIASSPATRRESSLSMTNAATFAPANDTVCAVGDFHTDLNVVFARTDAPSTAVTAATTNGKR